MMAPRINCIYWRDFGRCVHPDRPKFLWFKRMCCEPQKLCSIKEYHPRPTGPFPQVPLTEGKTRGGMTCKTNVTNHKRPILPPQVLKKTKRRAGFI